MADYGLGAASPFTFTIHGSRVTGCAECRLQAAGCSQLMGTGQWQWAAIDN